MKSTPYTAFVLIFSGVSLHVFWRWPRDSVLTHGWIAYRAFFAERRGPYYPPCNRNLTQQCFENDPFGEAMTGGRVSEPPSSSAEYERRSDPRRQPPYRDGRRRIYDDEGMGYDNNDDSGHGGYGGGFQGEEAGSWNAGASAESHPDGDGDATGEPQSEMPTQFPGVRAAYDTAGDGFDVRMQGGGVDDGGRGVGVDSDRRGHEDDDEGAVHGGKRRRRVVEEEEY